MWSLLHVICICLSDFYIKILRFQPSHFWSWWREELSYLSAISSCPCLCLILNVSINLESSTLELSYFYSPLKESIVLIRHTRHPLSTYSARDEHTWHGANSNIFYFIHSYNSYSHSVYDQLYHLSILVSIRIQIFQNSMKVRIQLEMTNV